MDWCGVLDMEAAGEGKDAIPAVPLRRDLFKALGNSLLRGSPGCRSPFDNDWRLQTRVCSHMATFVYCMCVCTGALALHEAVGAGRVHPDRVLKNTSSSQP